VDLGGVLLVPGATEVAHHPRIGFQLPGQEQIAVGVRAQSHVVLHTRRTVLDRQLR
jgi:hypothetical protein